MGEDGIKARSAVTRDRTGYAVTQQVFTGHPHAPQTVPGAEDKRQIEWEPWFWGKPSDACGSWGECGD